MAEGTADRLQRFTFRSVIEASAQEVFAWRRRPGALARLVAPWLPATVREDGSIQEGERTVLSLGIGPVRVRWEAVRRDLEEDRQYRDVQVKGPFESWTHTHRVEPEGTTRCSLVDHVSYELPLGELGLALGGRAVRKSLERQFAYRHRILEQDLATHRRYRTDRPLRVAITGSTGLIGSNLRALLTSGGHEVLRLVRGKPQAPDEVFWSPLEGRIDAERLEGVDAVVHLAGENVFALRWTDEKKARILRSRVEGTRLLAETIARLASPPSVFVSASGIGFYGDQGDRLLDESAPGATEGFLPQVCRAWEAVTEAAALAGIRTVRMRTGVVLTPAGGALRMMLPAFLAGLGGRIGGAGQYFSWIALDDVLVGYLHAILTPALAGPVNLTSPHPVTMETLARTLGRVLSRPTLLDVPASAVRKVFGEVADDALLASARAIPARLSDSAFRHLYPELEEALRHQLGRTTDPDPPHRPDAAPDAQ